MYTKIVKRRSDGPVPAISGAVPKNRKVGVLCFGCHCEKCGSTTKQSSGFSDGRSKASPVSEGEVSVCKTIRTTSQSTKKIQDTIEPDKWIATLPLVARNDVKRVAFTLAEVLITLTIIGVIAALTIPNLMQSYRKHQTEIRLKEAYNIIRTSIQLAEINSGTNSDEWNYYKLDDIKQYLWPMFKNSIICSGSRNNTYNGKPCVGSSLDKNGNAQYKNMDGTAGTEVLANSIILSNGMSIAHWNPNAPYVQLWIDIDGPNKGPEQLGYDIFHLNLLNKQSEKLKLPNPRFGQYDYLSLAGSSDPSYESAKTFCTQMKALNGYSVASICYAYIMKNGWKIPDDYPVKKW